MKLTFLGTGTSTGVPQLGCTCPVCTSTDPKDTRLRCSAWIETEQANILLDCGPDFRTQMLGRPFGPLDAVLITHEHYDHVGGLDDLRPYSVFGDVAVYADAYTVEHLRQRLPYCFAEHKYPGVPQINLITASPHQSFVVGDVEVCPIQVMHGKLPILGYRIGKMAYLTDVKTLPDTEYSFLDGIDVLVINALRYSEHLTHQTVDEALAVAHRVGAHRTYFIHFSHDVGLHADLSAKLPPTVEAAYDGLCIEIAD